LQLVEVVSRISAKCNDEKLEVLNLMRKLMWQVRVIDDHKQFVLLVANGMDT
jgi:hypothetical protein